MHAVSRSAVDAADDVRRHAQRVERQAEQIAGRAARVAVAAEALRAGHGARAQHDDAAPARAGARGRHPPSAAAADSRRSRRRAAWGSAGPGRRRAAATAAQRSATSRSSSARPERRRRPARSGRPPRRPAARPLSTRSMKVVASRSQPGSSTVSACRNSSQGKRARAAPAASWRPRPPPRCTSSAPALSTICGRAVAGAAIDHDHLAHEPVHGRRHQRRQGRGQRRLGVQGRDDDRDHAARPASGVRRTIGPAPAAQKHGFVMLCS